MANEKERLEKELRFLKESLEAGIISEDEYEKGRLRIEEQIAEHGEDFIGNANEGEPLEPEKEEEPEQEELKEEETPEEEQVEEPEEKETASNILDEVEKEQEETEKEPEKEEEPEEETEEQPEMEEEKPKPKAKKSEVRKRKPKLEKSNGDKSPVKVNRTNFRIITIIAIIILVILLMRRAPTMTDLIEDKFKAVCSTDEECINPGKVGICLSPGTREASCEFHEPSPVDLTVIGDRTCTSCDISRMISVLRQLFPGLDYEVVDANTPEGRAFISELDISVLPAYVFDEEINETMKFDKFKRALVKKGDMYLVTPTASGSNYLFSRMSRPYTFDLYVKADQDTTVLDNSMKEILNLFGDKINFNKHIVDKSDEDGLRIELAITTYPAYIINNQLKFTGTQAAEIIKNRFCYVNSLAECSTTLSLDVVKTS